MEPLAYYGFILTLIGSYAIFVIALYVLSIVANWRIFTKAGIDGWLSIIPLVNLYFLFKISLGNGWFALLLLIPVVHIFAYGYMCYRLSQNFGHGGLFTVGLIFFNFIFSLILAFEDNEYRPVNQNVF